MTVSLLFTIGLLFATGTFLMLRRNLLKLAIGLSLISHGSNLLLVAAGGFYGRRPPIIGEGEVPYVDPLVQALVLTAIVISFGVIAFLLVLIYRLRQEGGTVDLEKIQELRG